MPIYEYKCDNCGNIYEEMKAMKLREKSDCPKCGQPSRFLLSAGGFNLKGKDWYKPSEERHEDI